MSILIKSIMILLLLAISIQASGFVTKTAKEQNKVTLKTLLSGKHKDTILCFDFYKNSKLLSVSKNTIKLWDLKEQELISTFQDSSDYKKAEFSNDGTQIYILSNSKIAIYSSTTLKELSSIDIHYARDFVISSDGKKLLLLTYYGVTIYNLENGQELHNIKINGYQQIAVSPNNRYLAIKGSSDIKIYKMQTGALIAKLNVKANTISFTSNTNIYTVGERDVGIYNFKTSEKIYSMLLKQKISSSLIGNDLTKAFFASSYKLNMFDLETKKIIKTVQLDYRNISNNDLLFSEDNSLLAVGSYNGSFKIYKTRNLIDSVHTIHTVPPVAVKHLSVIKEKQVKKETPIVVATPTKKKEIQKRYIKPTLEIDASTTQGVIPLKVVFTILANIPDGIESYYINLAGQEKMARGKPPMSITKVFQESGTFKVLVAIKDKKGNIIKKDITITPREETFSDYKRKYQ